MCFQENALHDQDVVSAVSLNGKDKKASFKYEKKKKRDLRKLRVLNDGVFRSKS